MLQRVSPLFLLLPAMLSLGCSKNGGAPARQPDGGYHLVCSGPLVDCLQQTERLCRDQGYTVTRARDVHELLGHESGESQVQIRKSDAVVYCGKDAPSSERPMIEVKREAPVSVPPTTTEQSPALTCVPGTTQACVGPGGCKGGQACAPDGARYEACDCGASNLPAVSPN